MDPEKQAEKLLTQRADMLRKATEMTVENAIGQRVVEMLATGPTITLSALVESFQSDIDGYKGDRPEQSFDVVQARAVIAKIRSVTGTG